MNLSIVGNIVRIELEWYKLLLTFNWQNGFEIPLARLMTVTTLKPKQSPNFIISNQDFLL